MIVAGCDVGSLSAEAVFMENGTILGSEIPLSVGYVRERYDAGTEKPVIVYIQDAHCNYSCQKNIYRIIVV